MNQAQPRAFSKNSASSREQLARALKEIRGNQRVTSQNPEATYEALEKYGRGLYERLAAQGKLEPGYRPRRRNPAGDSGALAAEQK
jgi:ATP-dependent Clp protease ATP-binding subunit ClpB